MSDQSLQNFVIHIIVSIRRWKFYNYVKIENGNLDEFRTSVAREWPAAQDLVQRLQDKLEILLPQEEILYFALHFKSKHITELDEITSEEIEQVEKTLYDIYPVSYTHLDVYKRQTMSCSGCFFLRPAQC